MSDETRRLKQFLGEVSYNEIMQTAYDQAMSDLKNVIVVWPGTVKTVGTATVETPIPKKWKVCDGSNGTPDFRVMFKNNYVLVMKR